MRAARGRCVAGRTRRERRADGGGYERNERARGLRAMISSNSWTMLACTSLGYHVFSEPSFSSRTPLKFLWCRITRADTIPKEHGASRDQPGFLLLCEGGSMVHRAQSRATHEDDCFLMKILDTSVKRNRLSPLAGANGLLIHLTPPPRRSNPRFRATPARTRPSSRPRPGSSGSSPSSGCPSSSWWRT